MKNMQIETFNNTTPIIVPEIGTVGAAIPFPSQIVVNEMSGVIKKVIVTLRNISSTYPDDIGVLLVGPQGQTLILMSDVGKEADITNVTLTLDDDAVSPLPAGDPLVSGTFKPANYTDDIGNDNWPSPAPVPPYGDPALGQGLNVFNGTNPNGTWNLYVVDDAVDDISSIAEGWELTITIRSLEEILQDFIAVFPFGCFCPPSEEIILGIKNILNDLVVWSTVAFISGSLKLKLQNAINNVQNQLNIDPFSCCKTLQSFVNLFRILTTIVSTFDSLDLTQKTQSLVFLQEFQLIVSQSLLCLICPHPFAYITNFYSDNVSVIDVETNKVITIIPVGKHPSDVAITPDRQFVYVTNLTSKNISVINTETNSVIATIPVGGQPYGIAITPNGDFAYVSLFNNDVAVINTGTNNVVATISVGGQLTGIKITPNGQFAYVIKQNNNISVINTGTNSVVATIPVGSQPSSIAFTPDGQFAYVTIFNNNNVSVINTGTNSIVATIPIGGRPYGIAITPNAQFAYVSFVDNNINNKVAVINMETNSVVATIFVESQPSDIAITPDGQFVYVVCYGSNSVSVINTGTNSVVAIILVGSQPSGIAIK